MHHQPSDLVWGMTNVLFLMQEPWLLALLAFQALLLVSVIILRKSWNYNVAVLVLAGTLPLLLTCLSLSLGPDTSTALGKSHLSDFPEQSAACLRAKNAGLLWAMPASCSLPLVHMRLDSKIAH